MKCSYLRWGSLLCLNIYEVPFKLNAECLKAACGLLFYGINLEYMIILSSELDRAYIVIFVQPVMAELLINEKIQQ
ncbi:MAG: hypothetical protein HQ568_10775 [Calditrichaeota bacterium]|nr:hypothetical protein [Calditrichota bacterium]